MLHLQWAPAPRFPPIAIRRFFIALPLLFLTPLAAFGQNNPEDSEPVVLTVSVSPDRVPMTSGTATLTWSGENARYCSVDGVNRVASGSVTVGPWATAGTKSVLVECWNNGKAGYAAGTVSVIVYSVPKPVITTTLSKTLLEAGVDKFTVAYSATNAGSCMVGGTKFPPSGSATLGPYAAGKHSLTFSCSGDGGETSHTINWEAINRVSISASASPSTVTANGSGAVRVSWTGSNADSCTLDGASAAKSGSKTFGPYSYSQTGSKSATVSCANRLGSVSKTVTWTVNAPSPTVSATLSSYTVTAGVDRVDLSWTSDNTDSCSYGGRTRAVSGTIANLGPFTAGEHNFTVSCTGKGGTASDTATLTAEKPPEPPTVAVTVNPTAIEAGTETSTLTWSSEHTTSCSRGGNSVGTSGSATVGPYDSAGSRSFTVSCAGAGGSASGTATLTVDPPPPPDPPTVTVGLNPTRITAGSEISTLTWSSRNTTSCSRDGTTVATGGTATLGPYATAGTRRFTVSCTGPGGTASDTVRLRVNEDTKPKVTVRVSPVTVIANVGRVNLEWSSVRATACSHDGMDLMASGTLALGPFAEGSHDLTVTCTGMDGTGNAKATVTAKKAPDINGEPDTDGDGIIDSMDADDDNDGMPDACEIRYGFDPRNSVDGGNANSDGDGASNVHECRHGTDPTRTPANTVLTDTDGDGMYDAWELNNGLDPDDADDASLNDDGDGYTNLEEFNDRTDPQWDKSHKESIPELQFGFNSSYTVQVGMINAGDMLNDILVRNPTSGILPSVSDFVMIQKRGGGFEIKDLKAENYTIPAMLTDITSKATVVDINGDGAKDLVLTGLGTDTAAIMGAEDQVVYGNYNERYTIPEKHIALTATKKKFFADLSAWIDNEKYFETNVPISTTLEIDEAENTDAIQGSAGSQEYSPFGYVDLLDIFFRQNANKCIGLFPDECYLLSKDGFRGRLDPFVREQLRIRIAGRNRIYLDIKTGASGSTKPTTVNVYDVSKFDEEARMLALYYLEPIRESGSLQPGAANSKVISEMLEAVLDIPVLHNRLLGIGNGVLPSVEDHTSYTGTISDVLQSVDFQRDRITLPTPQNQISEEERNNSPNLDVLKNLPPCNRENPCTPSSFTDEQQDAIRVRIDELAEPIIKVGYSSADDAAIALHKSGLVNFSAEIGIEFYAIIDNSVTPNKIVLVSTNLYTLNTGDMGIQSIGLPNWHTHPSGEIVSQNDAAASAINNEGTICIDGVDHTTYVSGVRLSKANAKQMIDVSNPEDFLFTFVIHRNDAWETRTGTGLSVSERYLPNFSCNP